LRTGPRGLWPSGSDVAHPLRGAASLDDHHEHQHHHEHDHQHHQHQHQHHEHDHEHGGADHNHGGHDHHEHHTMTPEHDGQAELIAHLETLLTDVRHGRVVAVACVSINDRADYEPFWSTSETCVHAGAALRAAVVWLCTRMDAHAMHIALTREHESDPTLS
jgi:hypothetical protein